MVTVETGVRPEEIRFSAQAVLYVEGNPGSADPHVLRTLLEDTDIEVRPLGPSYHIRGAAEALHPTHLSYYFLIDRDHHDDKTVEDSWKNFPDPNTHNLLIWRRRELENYFLDPEYLMRSEHVTCEKRALKRCILQTARRRVFLDAVNLVIVQLREELKSTWIRLFDRTSGFETKSKAAKKLLGRPEFANRRKATSRMLARGEVGKRFDGAVEEFLDGSKQPAFGHGRWLQMIRGKHVLPELIDKCFRAEDTSGKRLHGNDLLLAVAKGLLRLPLTDQPDDFQQLHKLIREKVIKA